MRAAVVEKIGSVPQYRQVPDPEPADGQQVATVRAAAIKNIERMLVAGTHYASGALTLPAQVGVDAVVQLPDGRRVYSGAVPPGGAMAERIAVDPSSAIDLPDALDDATAAALPNAAISAWLALEYAGQIRPGHTVLILGGTGVTGGLAVQLAKHHFGAGHVVVVGRNTERLASLAGLGADETIGIGDGVEDLTRAVSAVHAEHPIDSVLDYVWGPPADRTLRAFGNTRLDAPFHRTRFVQIGESAGPTIELAADVLRSAGVEVVGQGAGSVPREAFARVTTEVIPALFELLAKDAITLETTTRPLNEVAEAWHEPVPSGVRTVLVP